MIENHSRISAETYAMVRFQHAALLELTGTLLKCLETGEHLTPKEKAFWTQQIAGLLDLCEKTGELFTFLTNQQISEQARLN